MVMRFGPTIELSESTAKQTIMRASPHVGEDSLLSQPSSSGAPKTAALSTKAATTVPRTELWGRLGACGAGLALLLLASCDRQAPDSGAAPSRANPTLAAQSKASLETNPLGTNSKAEMIPIPGGRFMMGDKNEVDATPHEVVVSAFSIDKYLVIQEQYQKIMGTNPS